MCVYVSRRIIRRVGGFSIRWHTLDKFVMTVHTTYQKLSENMTITDAKRCRWMHGRRKRGRGSITPLIFCQQKYYRVKKQQINQCISIRLAKWILKIKDNFIHKII